MNIYLFFEIILLFLYTQYRKIGYTKIYWISCCILFFIMSAHNGIFDNMFDYTSYMNLFLGKPSRYGSLDTQFGYELELPYYYLLKFLRIFPIEPATFIIGIAIVFCMPVFLLSRKESVNPALTVLLLLVLNNTSIFRSFMGAQRQMVGCVFYILAYFIYEHTELKYKKYFAIGFIALALMSHSSSIIVLPIFFLLYFVHVTPSKKYLYIMVASAWAIGMFLSSFIVEQATSFMYLLSDIDEIDRSTHYLIEEVFADQKTYALTALTPMALLISYFIYCYDDDELEHFSVKCWITAFLFYISLYSIPLMNRGMLLFFLIGMCGGIPKRINEDSRLKKGSFVLMLLFVYLAYRAYNRPGYLLLPYNFIWE